MHVGERPQERRRVVSSKMLYPQHAVKLRELLPWRSFTIGTRWPPGVAAAALRKCIDKDGTGLFAPRGKAPFKEARSSDVEFVFSRRIGLRNPSLPVIRVVIDPTRHGGTRLHVRMRLHLFVAAFSALWMGGAVLAGVVGLLMALTGRPSALLLLLAPLLGAAFFGFPFMDEADKAEQLLRAIYADAPERPDQGAYR
jgi:hypothetical protein